MLFELSDMLSNAENPERIIIDRHQMKNGLYVRIDREGNIKDNLIVNKETSTIGNTYWWFRDRDYYSNIINLRNHIFGCGFFFYCYNFLIKGIVFAIPFIIDLEK